MFLPGFACSLVDRIVEQTQRFGTQRRAIELEVDVLEGEFHHRRRSGHLNGACWPMAVPPLPSLTVTVDLDGAFLLRRGPDRLAVASGSAACRPARSSGR